MTTTTIVAHGSTGRPTGRRWLYLILCVVCMIMIANLQYGWSLFVLPLHQAHNWAVADIQFAFTLFIALETWGTPINGWIADSLGPHFGPRVVMGIGGILVAAGWIINSYTGSLGALYLGGGVVRLRIRGSVLRVRRYGGKMVHR